MRYILILLISLCLIPLTSEAFLSKKPRLSFIIEPIGEKNEEIIGNKHIDAVKNGSQLTLRWYTQAKILIQDKPWPQYRVALMRGILSETPTHPTNTFVHPHLWREGLLNLNPENRILFAPSSIIDKKSKNKKDRVIFEPGLIKAHYSSIKRGNEFILKTVREFREILSLINIQGLDSIPKLDKKEKKILTQFINEFPRVRFFQKTKTELTLNNQTKEIDTILFGNSYIHYTCLNDVQYPLIIKMEFILENVPNTMAPFMKFFKDHMEFKIKQIAWDKKASSKLYQEVKIHKIEDDDNLNQE